jgi:putative ABC transport system substrate-binding protein
MRRREFLTVLGSAVVWPVASRAQAGKVHTILWVSTEAQPDPFIAGFREGMRERGYVEGESLIFVLRYAPGDPATVQAMLPELLSIPADLIVSSGPAIQAMKAATGKSILFAISGDPAALGIAQSLSRPGRNFTGSTFLSLDVAQKRVELLRKGSGPVPLCSSSGTTMRMASRQVRCSPAPLAATVQTVRFGSSAEARTHGPMPCAPSCRAFQ